MKGKSINPYDVHYLTLDFIETFDSCSFSLTVSFLNLPLLRSCLMKPIKVEVASLAESGEELWTSGTTKNTKTDRIVGHGI